MRNNAKYQAIWTGVYGDCTNGILEYSVNNGTSYAQATGGIQNVTLMQVLLELIPLFTMEQLQDYQLQDQIQD